MCFSCGTEPDSETNNPSTDILTVHVENELNHSTTVCFYVDALGKLSPCQNLTCVAPQRHPSGSSALSPSVLFEKRCDVAARWLVGLGESLRRFSGHDNTITSKPSTSQTLLELLTDESGLGQCISAFVQVKIVPDNTYFSAPESQVALFPEQIRQSGNPTCHMGA